MKVRRITVVLNKQGSVGRRTQINWIMDRLSSNKWPTDHLECEMVGDGDWGIWMGDMGVIDWGKDHGEGACHERMGVKD